MTNQEINEAVARKLGHGANGTDCHGHVSITDIETGKTRRIWPPNDYSTSIEAAFECLAGRDFSVSHGTNAYTLERQFVCFINIGPQKGLAESADTAPLAICMAFLKLPAT